MNFRVVIFFVPFFVFINGSQAQRKSDIQPFHVQHDFKNPDSFFQNATSPNKKRQKSITGIALGGYSLGLLYMGTQWYANEDLTKFHFFHDLHEWQQIDKGGHMLGSYSASRWVTGLYRWAGVEKEKQ